MIGPNQFEASARISGKDGDGALDLLLRQPAHPRADSLTVNFTPRATAAGQQLRVRIGGVHRVRQLAIQRRVRVLREQAELRAHAGNQQTASRSTPSSGSTALFYIPNEPPTYDTEFDGFTVVLTCRAPRQSRRQKHVASRIADTSDGISIPACSSGERRPSNRSGVAADIAEPALDPACRPRTAPARGRRRSFRGTSITLKVTGGKCPRQHSPWR